MTLADDCQCVTLETIVFSVNMCRLYVRFKLCGCVQKRQVAWLLAWLFELFVCLFVWACPQVGLPGPSDFVNRSLTPGKDQCSLSLRTHECRADFLTLRICRPATPLILCFSSVHLQTQLRRVSDRCGDADDAGKQWSNQDEWPRLLALNKPALIRCQAEQPN